MRNPLLPLALALSLTACPGEAANLGAPAPEVVGIDAWIYSPPLTMAELRGKVVLVGGFFWTFGCFNCRNTLPASSAGTRSTPSAGSSCSRSTRPSSTSRSCSGARGGGARARHHVPRRDRRELPHVARVREPLLARVLLRRPEGAWTAMSASAREPMRTASAGSRSSWRRAEGGGLSRARPRPGAPTRRRHSGTRDASASRPPSRRTATYPLRETPFGFSTTIR